IVATMFMSVTDFIFLAVLAGLLAGVLAGVLNGILISYVHLPAFIATLGMLSVARGVAYALSGGIPIYDIPDRFIWLGQGTFLRIPVPIIFLFVIATIGAFSLNKTKFGIFTFAIGSNPETARMSGINFKRHLIWVYSL